MRKTILLLAVLLMGASSVNAALAPMNVQQAYIGDTHDDQLTIGVDWFRDHVRGGLGIHTRSNTINMPRVDWRHTFDTSIPVRIGLSTGITTGFGEVEAGGVETESSAFGFNNLGLSLEAAVVNEEDKALTLYINQTFPFVHNDLLSANQLRPVMGANAYGFQTGAEYQIKLLDGVFGDSDSLVWFGDVGYRFDVPEAGATQHSLVYYNEAVWSGDNFGLSMGLLGNSIYTDDLGTDLRLVPGVIVPVNDSQVRIGFPIGLTSDSPDLGIQASLYTVF